MNLKRHVCNLFLLLTDTLSISACEIKNEKRKARGVLEMSKAAPGTYQGTIIEISARQRLAYLQTTDDQIMELIFKSDTILTADGKKLPLKKVRKGYEIEFTVSKISDSLKVEKLTVLRYLK